MRAFPVVLLVLFLGLAACSGPADKHYSYDPIENPGGRLCTLQCSNARNYCAQNCDMDQRMCTTQVQGDALKDYEQYTRDQFINHQPITLQVRDFEHLNSCDDNKKSCGTDCEDTYRSCYESCGGHVRETTSCQFFCF